MPLGAVAQRLGDRRKGPGVPGPGVRLPLLPLKRLEKSSLFLLYTVELPAPDWYFSVVAREIHLGRSMPFQCTVSYAACLDEAISATSSQGNANTDSCGGASLPG